MPPDSEKKSTRVAVIAVPGVGDDGLGDTADTLTNALIREGCFDWAIHNSVTVRSQASTPQAGGPLGIAAFESAARRSGPRAGG